MFRGLLKIGLVLGLMMSSLSAESDEDCRNLYKKNMNYFKVMQKNGKCPKPESFYAKSAPKKVQPWAQPYSEAMCRSIASSQYMEAEWNRVHTSGKCPKSKAEYTSNPDEAFLMIVNNDKCLDRKSDQLCVNLEYIYSAKIGKTSAFTGLQGCKALVEGGLSSGSNFNFLMATNTEIPKICSDLVEKASQDQIKQFGKSSITQEDKAVVATLAELVKKSQAIEEDKKKRALAFEQEVSGLEKQVAELKKGYTVKAIQESIGRNPKVGEAVIPTSGHVKDGSYVETGRYAVYKGEKIVAIYGYSNYENRRISIGAIQGYGPHYWPRCGDNYDDPYAKFAQGGLISKMPFYEAEIKMYNWIEENCTK